MKWFKLLLMLVLVRVAMPGFKVWTFTAVKATLHSSSRVWEIRDAYNKQLMLPAEYTIVQEL